MEVQEIAVLIALYSDESIRRANRVIQTRTFVLMLIMGIGMFFLLFFKLLFLGFDCSFFFFRIFGGFFFLDHILPWLF